jgi:hypothetical protein
MADLHSLMLAHMSKDHNKSTCRNKSQCLLVQSMKIVTLLSAFKDSQLNFANPFRCSRDLKHHIVF